MDEEEKAGQPLRTRARHIKKRALKNKALSVSFDEKELNDFVTGFHKRKKKRRKEAELQQQEVLRKKRIEARKKRKMERDATYGGTTEETSTGAEGGDVSEQDEEIDLAPSVAGTTTYDNGDVTVTVTTCEISRDDEEAPSERSKSAALGGEVKKQQKPPVVVKKKKPVVQKRTRTKRKEQKKRDKVKARRQT